LQAKVEDPATEFLPKTIIDFAARVGYIDEEQNREQMELFVKVKFMFTFFTIFLNAFIHTMPENNWHFIYFDGPDFSKFFCIKKFTEFPSWYLPYQSRGWHWTRGRMVGN
jgi:hypothetical protein